MALDHVKRNLIAAYVDGELDGDAAALFEDHLQSCASCREELRVHRLLVCQLDAAMTKSVEIPVPADFSRTIAARASSDMRGVRTSSEHKKALSICVILALAGFALLGAAARDAIFLVAGRFLSSVLSVAGSLSTMVYDGVAGLVVISRVVGHKIVIESGLLGVLLVLLALAVFLLTRLLSHYHRTGATE